ncbi:MAG: NADP-dependent isocitrate dehydrogenase [Albidovulum sp.]
MADALSSHEAQITSELRKDRGTAADLGGYYHTDPEKTLRVMAPSKTLNRILTAR